MAKEKIAILLHGLYGGGAERVMLNLALGMIDRKYQIDLVLIRAEGPYLKEVPNRVRIVDLKAGRVLTGLNPLVQYLRVEQPDALLSSLHTNILAIWANRLAGSTCRVVVSEHNTLSRVAKGKSDLRWKVFPFLARWFYPWADGIVAVSNGVANDLACTTGISRERIRVIFNPVITKELRRKAEEPVLHPWLNPTCVPVILAVGRLTQQKDFPLLIRAFNLIRQTREARLIILGEGELRSELEALVQQLGIQNDVCIPGFVSNPYPYMRSSSTFVLSSRWEGLPTVLIEALYFGLPVVSTDCPSGPREILKDGKYGRLVPMGDCEALAREISRVLDNKSNSLSNESWIPYSTDIVLDQYLDLLRGA